jgi:acetate kinase
MNPVIVTCNAGSTNSKFAAFDSITLEKRGHTVTHSAAEAVEWLCAIGSLGISAIGHRVVHGGRDFIHPVLVTDEVMDKLQSYVSLAPLHQPAALKLIEETQRLYPHAQHIACFDTAFHHTVSDIERRLPLPRWYHNEGMQRYGFHGLSYQHIADVLPHYTPDRAMGRVIVAHLGGGSSACAMKNLKSVATTMGFSTLDGMMMGTRCGTLDPGAVLHLLNTLEMKPAEVSQLLYLESGLQGVSGINGNMQHLLTSDKPQAKEAIDLYCNQAAKQIAGLLPTLGGLDVLVFTGGIGEHAEEIREQIISHLRWIGNFSIYVIPTDEELVIAQACHALAK